MSLHIIYLSKLKYFHLNQSFESQIKAGNKHKVVQQRTTESEKVRLGKVSNS